MRKTLLCGGVALFALAAAPCFAQDVGGAAATVGNEIGKAATSAARDAADSAASSVGMKSKSADKKHSSTRAAQNTSSSKPVYSAGPAAEDNGGAAPSDQPANAQPSRDPSDGKGQ